MAQSCKLKLCMWNLSYSILQTSHSKFSGQIFPGSLLRILQDLFIYLLFTGLSLEKLSVFSGKICHLRNISKFFRSCQFWCGNWTNRSSWREICFRSGRSKVLSVSYQAPQLWEFTTTSVRTTECSSLLARPGNTMRHKKYYLNEKVSLANQVDFQNLNIKNAAFC